MLKQWVPQTVENFEWWETENMCQTGGVGEIRVF